MLPGGLYGLEGGFSKCIDHCKLDGKPIYSAYDINSNPRLNPTPNLDNKDLFSSFKYSVRKWPLIVGVLMPFSILILGLVGGSVSAEADTEDPVAVPPGDITVDVGQNVTLDGSRSTDNVAIESWKWSFEEHGLTTTLEGEFVDYAFKEAKIYSVTLKVTDTSGRSGSRSLATFTVTAVDRTPPIADAGRDLVVNQGARVQFDGHNSTDNVGIVSYTWSFIFDGASRLLSGVAVDFEFRLPGVYDILLVVKDVTGFSDSATITVTVEDTSAPITTLFLDPIPPLNRIYDEVVQIFLTIEGENPGVTTYIRVNDGQWSIFTGSLAFGDGSVFGDGTYEIDYYSIDISGNTEMVKSIESFSVDATTPSIQMINPSTEYQIIINKTDIDISISGATERGAKVKINGLRIELQDDGIFRYNVTLDEGLNLFTISAVDSVGHQGQVECRILVDTIPPKIVLSNPSKTPFKTTHDYYIIQGITEVGSSIYLNNNQVMVIQNGAFSSNVSLRKGSNEFRIMAIDQVGHQSVKSFTIVYTEPTNTIMLILFGILVVLTILTVTVLFHLYSHKRSSH